MFTQVLDSTSQCCACVGVECVVIISMFRDQCPPNYPIILSLPGPGANGAPARGPLANGGPVRAVTHCCMTDGGNTALAG